MKTNSGRFSLHRTMALAFLLVTLLTVALVALLVYPSLAGAESPSATTSAVATASAPEHVTPAVAAVKVGTVVIDDDADQAIVPISINPGATPVVAFQFEIVYDAQAMTPTGCVHLSGFGVCAPKDDGRLVLNAASVKGWDSSTDVVELRFDVRHGAAIRIGEVVGVWGNDSHHASQVNYDVIFGAVHVGDQREATAYQLPSSPLDSGGAVTGTASSGVHDSGLYGAGVCAMHEQSHRARCAVTNSRGEYRIEGLTPGSYVVEYLGAEEHALHQIAGVIVEPEGTTQGIDFDLREPAAAAPEVDVVDDAADAAPSAFAQGELVGSVSDASGAPVAATLVCATDIGIGTEVCGATRFDGTYTVRGLHAGNYTVTVTDPGQRFDATSTPVFGFDAQTIKHIDVTLTGS